MLMVVGLGNPPLSADKFLTNVLGGKVLLLRHVRLLQASTPCMSALLPSEQALGIRIEAHHAASLPMQLSEVCMMSRTASGRLLHGH